MLIKKPDDIKSSDITDKALYLSRREFMGVSALSLGAVAAGLAAPGLLLGSKEAEASTAMKLNGLRKSAFSTKEELTPYKDVTTYNNFYEFGTDKYSPAQLAGTLSPRPWTITVEGEVKKPKTYDIDALLKLAPLEERIYRLRCVEGWSMVIPWAGFPLSALIKQVQPNGNAKFVEFISLNDPKQMPGQRSSVGGQVGEEPRVQRQQAGAGGAGQPGQEHRGKLAHQTPAASRMSSTLSPPVPNETSPVAETKTRGTDGGLIALGPNSASRALVTSLPASA